METRHQEQYLKIFKQPAQEHPSNDKQLFQLKQLNNHSFEEVWIDRKALPFIFNFHYLALQRMKIIRNEEISDLTLEIFYYLKSKLVVPRSSKTFTFPNRMKDQEKVKFLIRAFEQQSNVVLSKRQRKFNKQSQAIFFNQINVIEDFHKFIEKALKRKSRQNEQKIRDFQKKIEKILQLELLDINEAKRLFQFDIKHRQLPWTDNMFKDIKEFSILLYDKYVIKGKNDDQQTSDRSEGKADDFDDQKISFEEDADDEWEQDDKELPFDSSL